MNSNQKYLILTGTLMMVFLTSCESKNEISDAITVANVNRRAISDSEFILAYEYTPQSITHLDLHESYDRVLQSMIDRVLLAQEGENRGYDTDTTIQRFVDYYKRAAITRELYLDHIRDSIKVTDDEIRLGYQLSKTTLFVKHYEFSKELKINTEIENLLSYVHTPIMDNLKTIDHPEFGAVDIVNWNDLEEELESILFKLEIKQPSNPIKRYNKYHIFMVMGMEQELFLTDNDFLLNKNSISNIIERRKEHVAAFNYVRRIMTPEDLHLKSAGLKNLSEWLWKTYQGIPQDLRQELSIEIPYQLSDENILLDEPLAIFGKQEWSIRDFLFYYTVKPLTINYQGVPTIISDIKNALAIYVRDFVMSEQGIAEGLVNRPEVIKEEQYWKEQLMAEKVKSDIYRSMAHQFEQTKIDRDQFLTLLSNYLTDLRNTADIAVDTSALYAVATSNTGLARKIDFVSTLLP